MGASGRGFVTGMAARRQRFILAGLTMLTLALVCATAVAGHGSGSTTTGDEGEAAPVQPAGKGKIYVDDIKLNADFSRETLITGGRRIPFDNLLIAGGAHLDPGKGLAVFKGGVNEIIDPSFEGAGWKLGPGAAIDDKIVSFGKHSLRIDGDGSSRLVAGLKQPVKVVSGETRTLSLDHNYDKVTSGDLRVVLKAMDAGGQVVGSQNSTLGMTGRGWQHTGGFIYDLPEGTTSYTVEIFAEGLVGTSYLDAIMSEPKDFFTPYFDGDSENCRWVDAATPQNFTVDANRFNLHMAIKGLFYCIIIFFVAASAFLVIQGFYKHNHRRMLLGGLIILPAVAMVLIGAGLIRTPPVGTASADRCRVASTARPYVLLPDKLGRRRGTRELPVHREPVTFRLA